MNSYRSVSVATILAGALLAGACNSPTRPSGQPNRPIPPTPPVPALVSVTGLVSEAPADPDASAMPISGATISITYDAMGSTASAVTDENGWYEVEQSRGGATVTVAKEGYETLVTAVDLSDDTVLNFELKRAQ